jgi:hypothetical protein
MSEYYAESMVSEGAPFGNKNAAGGHNRRAGTKTSVTGIWQKPTSTGKVQVMVRSNVQRRAKNGKGVVGIGNVRTHLVRPALAKKMTAIAKAKGFKKGRDYGDMTGIIRRSWPG